MQTLTINETKGHISDSALRLEHSIISIPVANLRHSESFQTGVGLERTVLAIEASCSTLQIIAQDVFATFINKIAEIVGPLKDRIKRVSDNPLEPSRGGDY
jgi:hypothetical protein